MKAIDREGVMIGHREMIFFAIVQSCKMFQKNKGRAAYNRAEYWEHRVKLMQWWADIVSEWVD